MNFGQRLKTAINSFSKTSNSFTGSNDFLKNGNRNKMMSDWTSVSMSDEDFYTGYSYAAINNRANKTSQVAMKYLKTTANKTILDSYKKKEETLVHPYLALIEDSVEYSEYDFWYDISTYMDLEGISYILVTRTVEGDRVGTAQEFEVLNPYEIRRIRDKNTLDIGGYVETRDGMVREISPKQMIEIRKLNPFSRDSSFAMTDAAKDAQFTLKQAGDYTRHSLKNNQSAPGIISTDVMLEPEQFKNFVSRITNQDKGMPIFGNGSGAVTWDSMQIDLDKASLNTINETNRSTLFAVSGMSKTSMGIEESGTTRDVSKTQTDNLIENHIMPQIQKVIDALNLDYKKYSPKEYANDKMLIVLDNPLGKDKDVESKEVTIAGDKIKLRQDLIALGYTIELASKYANGEIELDELGLPTEEVKQIEAKTKEEPKSKVDGSKKEDKQAVEDAKAENAYLKELISFLVQKRKNQAEVLTVDKPIVFENQIASRDYPELYNDIDINPDDLGCIMLNTEPIYVTKYIKDGVRDLVESTNRHDHTMGAVSEVESHLTLLYGLLENGNKWKSKVDSLLKDWKINSVTIQEISYFDLEESYAIIAKIKKTDNLLDGHNRLTLLPHINTFSDYEPHITLAYINKDVNPEKWTKPLSTIYNGKTIKTTSINYGDKESSKKSNNAIQDTLPIINQVNIIEDQQNALKSTINKIQADIIKSVLIRVAKNAFNEQDDIILTSDREESESDLRKQLVIFYTALFLIYGPQLFNKRKSEFEDVKSSKFILTPTVKSIIDDFASKASKSHIDTILNDLLDTSNMAYEKSVETEVARLLKESGKKEADKAMYDLARKKALEGEGRVQIISAIKKEYQDISTTRANTIARTETQRAFNQSQYQADVQFLNDNDLMGRAYKQWKTRSAEPCQYCIDLSKEPPIPFDNNFRDLGDELSYIYTKKDGNKVKRSLQVDYEELSAGNAHVNCGCVYVLIIKDGSGNFVQSFDINIDEFDKIENYNKNHGDGGRFSSGPGGAAPATLSELYSKYSGLEETLKGMNKITNSYSQKEFDRLDKIYDEASRAEVKVIDKRYALIDELEAKGMSSSKIDMHPRIVEFEKIETGLREKANSAWAGSRGYVGNMEKNKAILKEKLYQSVYGDEWQGKYADASLRLRDWAENKYGKAKQGMKGDNFGSLELEHALTQAYYLDKGISEVEIYWGLYGDAASSIKSSNPSIKASLSSVTTDKKIAESYASMDRITKGTKKMIMDRSIDLPQSGVVVKARVPVNMIAISYETIADVGFNRYEEQKSSERSPGAFLKDQKELIIKVPKNADVSKYEEVETDSGIIAMHESALRGKRWEEIR